VGSGADSHRLETPHATPNRLASHGRWARLPHSPHQPRSRTVTPAELEGVFLRAVRVGKAYRILEDDVDAYLAARFTQAG
jgi:hypothetical protein